MNVLQKILKKLGREIKSLGNYFLNVLIIWKVIT